MTIWRAALETRNFSFEAFGDSLQTAIAALTAGLQRHARTYKLDEHWHSELFDDVQVTQIEQGDCFRGPEKI